ARDRRNVGRPASHWSTIDIPSRRHDARAACSGRDLILVVCRGGSRLPASALFVRKRNRGDREPEMHSGHCNERKKERVRKREGRAFMPRIEAHIILASSISNAMSLRKRIYINCYFSTAINECWDLLMIYLQQWKMTSIK
ncbi:hypothetical protein ALC57_05685, partial [Trachymyrmex cornetzi]